MDISGYRAGHLEDASAVTGLLLRSYDQYQQELAPEHWSALSGRIGDKDYINDLIRQSSLIVYEQDGVISGVIFLVPSGNPTNIYPNDWSYIRLLGVDPAMRGSGVGQQLMELAISKARSNGETILGLHTSTIMLAARRMYERLGFSVVKELEPLLGVQYWLYRIDL
ncbi:MAG: GNAT family N-acetyltransferase [Chitinophaga sp.]|uniref:GNAT family N-acetyltransferase n=1 Tax=Chitinophaga sp. TaxID=1869181 RepID=UPI0025C2445B|nr:GNAT family N-acetyltransferase [Chitinophaga sp.]MBV8254522.1 GNAT family N-acetyltransferase [Chitinophaga sp.]